MTQLDENLLEILICPKCKGELKKEGEQLVCAACSLAYPITEGMPRLVAEEAMPLKSSE